VSARAAVLLVAVMSFAAASGWSTSASADPSDPTTPERPVPPPRIVAPPDTNYSYAEPQYYPTLPWVLAQLVPSPEIGGGRVQRTGIDAVPRTETALAFGLRWQLAPVLWSWGTNRHLSRWRFFVSDPLARHSGSVELDGTFEYLFGHIDRMIVRPTLRATFPLYHRGEYLSGSLGTSTYAYDGTMRVAYEAGLYVLSGVFGVQVTYAPAHDPLGLIGTFRIRYF